MPMGSLSDGSIAGHAAAGGHVRHRGILGVQPQSPHTRYDSERAAQSLAAGPAPTTWTCGGTAACTQCLTLCWPCTLMPDGSRSATAATLMTRAIWRNTGPTSLATDISDTFLARAKAEGLIAEYRVENAERLRFPMRARFRALQGKLPSLSTPHAGALRDAARGTPRHRADRAGPDAHPQAAAHRPENADEGAVDSDWPAQAFRAVRPTEIIDFGRDWYEEVGNYGYCITRREIERVALGLDYARRGVRGINDAVR